MHTVGEMAMALEIYDKGSTIMEDLKCAHCVLYIAAIKAVSIMTIRKCHEYHVESTQLNWLWLNEFAVCKFKCFNNLTKIAHRLYTDGDNKYTYVY